MTPAMLTQGRRITSAGLVSGPSRAVESDLDASARQRGGMSRRSDATLTKQIGRPRLGAWNDGACFSRTVYNTLSVT